MDTIALSDPRNGGAEGGEKMLAFMNWYLLVILAVGTLVVLHGKTKEPIEGGPNAKENISQ